MDPDAVLADIVDLVDAVLDDEADIYPDNLGADAVALAEGVKNLHVWLTRGDPDNLGADAVALAEGVKNLHVWLTRGGFLPAVWRGE